MEYPEEIRVNASGAFRRVFLRLSPLALKKASPSSVAKL